MRTGVKRTVPIRLCSLNVEQIREGLVRLFHLPVAHNSIFILTPVQTFRRNVSDLNIFLTLTARGRDYKFFQQMTRAEEQALLQQIKSDYSQILINYFTTDKKLKEKIDKFVNAVFCANIPVPQIIEIHMELIDEFSKQLKLEGRSDEALLDYRLTLIDILAHLCELYRCSLTK